MRRNWRAPITPADLAVGQIRPNSERVICVRKLRVLRRIFVGSLSERSSPSESSLANSGAIRSDGRKNPSVGFLRSQKSERLLRFSVISDLITL